jgi:hypothetical protein
MQHNARAVAAAMWMREKIISTTVWSTLHLHFGLILSLSLLLSCKKFPPVFKGGDLHGLKVL